MSAKFDFEYLQFAGSLDNMRQVFDEKLPEAPPVPCECGNPAMRLYTAKTLNGFNVVAKCDRCSVEEVLTVVGQIATSTLN